MAYQQLSQQLAEELGKANAVILAMRTEGAKIQDQLAKSQEQCQLAEQYISALQSDLAARDQASFISRVTSGKNEPGVYGVKDEVKVQRQVGFAGFSKPGVERTAKPTVETVSKPTSKPIAKAATKPATQLTTKSTTKPIAKPTEEIIYGYSSSEEDLPKPNKIKLERHGKAKSLAKPLTSRTSSTSFPSRDKQTNLSHRIQKPATKQTNAKKAQNGKLFTAPAHLKRRATNLHASLAETTPFEFTLITAYTSPNKAAFDFFHSTDVPAHAYVQDLWALIDTMTESWEAVAGAEWQLEFEKTSIRRRGRVCVASKFAKRPTVWRDGDDGFFACQNCAGMGRPCFTYEGEEFWCLPLAEADRRCPVVKEKEIRYWINERGDLGDAMVLG